MPYRSHDEMEKAVREMPDTPLVLNGAERCYLAGLMVRNTGENGELSKSGLWIMAKLLDPLPDDVKAEYAMVPVVSSLADPLHPQNELARDVGLVNDGTDSKEWTG